MNAATVYNDAQFLLRGIKGISCVKIKATLTFEAPFLISNTDILIRGKAYFGAYSFFRGGRVSSLASIGRFCSVGPGVAIGDGEHPLSFMSTHQFQYGGKGFDFWPDFAKHKAQIAIEAADLKRSPPVIGNDVWIGANAFIGRGVNIGHGAVVAAGAVVVSDVPPYQIYGGVPAKLIRPRFNPEITAQLLALEWWNYTLKTLNNLPFRNVTASITALRKKIDSGQAELFTPVLVRT
jgi:virginiamycin A acetyltransferase